jgi:two-component system sensor histidine kinase KdpD
MDRERPNPDELLAEVKAAAARERRGRLKIFFGGSAGVGKTYAMLTAAHAQRRAGTDVVVGLLETHGRAETEALLEGLEQIPPQMLDVQGTPVKEFDLDAALKRRPTLILVDELAHTNVEGSRHPKRWQDIEELLASGIDVFTTLNVQHLESLNDVVGQITGIRVNETLPDTFFEAADEVELIDLPPDELLVRMREGKVYVPQQVERALDNFFKKGNLIALREMALRQTADRVDAQMREYREEKAIAPVWAAGERIVVAIGPDRHGEQRIRAAKRLADGLDAPWHAVYVETPRLLRLPQTERNHPVICPGEQLAKTTVLSGARVADELIDFALANNATKLLIGPPANLGLQRWLFGSVVDSVTARLRGIDLQIVGDTDATTAHGGFADQLARTKAHLGIDESKPKSRKQRWPGYAAAVAICAAATALAWSLFGSLGPTNLVMVYLLGVLAVAYRFGRGPAVVASLLSVALFDFLFIPPYYSFAVTDTQYLLTFAVMLLVGLVISNLTASVRLQARVAQHRQARTEALYTMTRELSRASGTEDVVTIAVRHVSAVFGRSPSCCSRCRWHDPISAGAGHLRLAARRRPRYRALGLRQPRRRRPRDEYASRRRCAVRPAGGGAPAGRRARRPTLAARPSADPGATASAGNLRRADRLGHRAHAALFERGTLPQRRRRTAAHRAALIDLARSSHSPRRAGRSIVEPGRRRRYVVRAGEARAGCDHSRRVAADHGAGQ